MCCLSRPPPSCLRGRGHHNLQSSHQHGESTLLIASEREPTFQKLSRKLVQSGSMLRLVRKHLYPPFSSPPSLSFSSSLSFSPSGCLPPERTPVNTSYTTKTETNIPSSFHNGVLSNREFNVLPVSVLRKPLNSCVHCLASAVCFDGSLTDWTKQKSFYCPKLHHCFLFYTHKSLLSLSSTM